MVPRSTLPLGNTRTKIAGQPAHIRWEAFNCVFHPFDCLVVQPLLTKATSKAFFGNPGVRILIQGLFEMSDGFFVVIAFHHDPSKTSVPVGGLFKLGPFHQALQLLGGDIFKVAFVPSKITKFIPKNSIIILYKVSAHWSTLTCGKRRSYQSKIALQNPDQEF